MTKPKITPTHADPLLSSAQAAVALQCSLRSVQLWCEAGLLAYQSTPGGHRRIATSEVSRFQEARKAKLTGLRRSRSIGCRAAYHSAGLVARVVLAFGALDRPDRIVTAASLVAAVVGFVILLTSSPP